MQLAQDTLLADRYRISRLLGQGGMGAVYLAVDIRFRDAPVAVKQKLVGAHREDLRKAFEREALLLNHLRHPALPRVTDFFMHGDSEFLVMEYVPGKDLGAELERARTPFPFETVAAWTDRLLDALAYLHSRTPPVIHRDIKPQNVRLTPEGEIILLDFGLSKGSVGAGLTAGASVIAGTPNYAPPEQLGGRGTDERADLFSLAATVYCLLTAGPPVDANQRLSNFINGEEDPLPPADRVNPAVPPAFAAVLQSALNLRRDDRPESAVAMREAIRASLGDFVRTLPPVKAYGATDASRTHVETGGEATEAWPGPDGRLPAGEPTVPEPSPDRRLRDDGTGGATTPVANVPVAPRSRSTAVKRIAMAMAFLVFLLVVTVGAVAVWQFWPEGERLIAPSPEPSPIREDTPSPSPSPLTSEELVTDLGDGVKIEMVSVPAGSFDMGGTVEANEQPVHRVTITKPFLMGKYEVTQAQWMAVMGQTLSNFNWDPDHPVEQVSWTDCQEFIRKLNAKTGLHFRLPTEAEWEYACRAGTTGTWAGDLDAMGWYYENSGTKRLSDATWDFDASVENENRPHAVGTKLPNAWGLYDMHGNVWEWCQDWSSDTYYKDGPLIDPAGPATGTRRVARGGGWNDRAESCRSAYRGQDAPGYRYDGLGLRLARTP